MLLTLILLFMKLYVVYCNSFFFVKFLFALNCLWISSFSSVANVTLLEVLSWMIKQDVKGKKKKKTKLNWLSIYKYYLLCNKLNSKWVIFPYIKWLGEDVKKKKLIKSKLVFYTQILFVCNRFNSTWVIFPHMKSL